MDKYKRYTGIIIFILAICLVIFVAWFIIRPQYEKWTNLCAEVEKVSNTLQEKQRTKMIIVKKLKSLQDSVLNAQKKIYSPVENKLGNDTLFFTLYSDLIEMVRANTIKIRSIDYKYNPYGDIFVQQKGSMYFVCDVNIEVISNYVNLGKLIQDIYQYPYYIKINSIEVSPYQKDKKILLTTLSVRLYAHTSPEEEVISSINEILEDDSIPITEKSGKINGATVPIPKQ